MNKQIKLILFATCILISLVILSFYDLLSFLAILFPINLVGSVIFILFLFCLSIISIYTIILSYKTLKKDKKRFLPIVATLISFVGLYNFLGIIWDTFLFLLEFPLK
jgi:hypothetical protein